MESVSARELKNRLGHYLRVVRQGKAVMVTSRGKPVACLVPVATHRGATALPPEVENRMWELAAEGFLTWGGSRFQVPDPVAVNLGPRLLSDLVVEGRK